MSPGDRSASPPRRRGRGGWLSGLVLMAPAVLGGCRVDATVETRVHGRGGTVTARFVLDREAVALLGGQVGEGAQTSDLHQAGWSISPVRRTPTEGAEVAVSKDFGRPEDLGRVMAELSGPAGPLRSFGLERHRSFARVRYRLRGTAEIGPGGAATGFGNVPDLRPRLRDAGIDPGRVEELLASRAVEGFGLRVVAALPGRERAWDIHRGPPLPIEVTSSVTDPVRPALLLVALLSGLGALRRWRRR